MQSTRERNSDETGQLLVRCHSSMPSDKLVILLVCEKEIEKKELALALVNIKKPFKVDVHITRSLPFITQNSSRSNIDFIVFMIDTTSRSSKQNIEESLKYVDISYFNGRSCFLVLNSLLSDLSTCDVDEIAELEEIYKCPVLYGNLKVQEELYQLSNQIMNQAEISAGLKGQVTSTFLEAASGVYWSPEF